MTPEAKKAIPSTIRGLRHRLLQDLHVATEPAYRLSVRPQDVGLDKAAWTKRKRLDDWFGVSDQTTYKVHRLDEDFFAEFEEE